MTEGRIRIGCSGWNYAGWRNEFYPPRTPASRWLEHYAKRFDTVEVNSTFYRLAKRVNNDWEVFAPRNATALRRLLAV